VFVEQMMLFGVDNLKKVFEQKFPPFAMARNVGLDILNAIPYLKNKIAAPVQT
jgi:2-polyprenyl-6-methoxyphenol hydroxylase-like FAD-dependent oxidoreductase